MADPQTTKYAFREGVASRYIGGGIKGYADRSLQLEFAHGWNCEDERLQTVMFYWQCLNCDHEFPEPSQEERRKAPGSHSHELRCPKCDSKSVTLLEQKL